MASAAQIPSSIVDIMRRRGVRCTPTEFQNAVNVTFHEFESEVYDQEHADMWNSLPHQFELLLDDCLRAHPGMPADIRLLDIGCGTGLATDCILKTRLGERITSVDLLDTSPAMLQRARERAGHWRLPVNCHRGLLDTLPAGNRYDLIVTCSVLHHVPDIPQFLAQVRAHQPARGVFIHLQDPNGDYLVDPTLQQRMVLGSKRSLTDIFSRLTPGRVLRRLRRTITGKQRDDYIAKTTRALLQAGVISSPLTVVELFSITDIHVQDGEGVSMKRMTSWMTDYLCRSQRSYGFFGQLWSTLPPRLRAIEEDLIRAKAQNGFHIGAVWSLT